MKCPKCSYLGFETGDRCRNCGYDFSLMADAHSDAIDIDLDLRSIDADLSPPAAWPDALDAALGDPDPSLEIEEPLAEPEPEPPQVRPELEFDAEPPLHPEPLSEVEPDEARPLPLFTPAFRDNDDEPLIKLPAAPRPPLAVRRTPDAPRLRVVAKAARAAAAEPALEFDEKTGPPLTPKAPPVSRIWAERHPAAASQPVGGGGVRLAAAAIDHVLLAGVDLIVMYFTARIAGLPMSAWSTLPPVPLFAFLILLKLAYFSAFTAVGGQTIGKMALRIRVVTAEEAPVDAALAIKRALAAAVSAMFLGLGYVPAFFDVERRTLHDRVARTRVVTLPSA